MHIVVAGGTGFLGSALAARWRGLGHEVTVLTRRPHRPGEARWDPAGPPATWSHVVDGADAVVNLAGEAMDARRWTTARKEALRSSRVVAAGALADAIAGARRPPAVFISSSGVGIYGAKGDEPVTEATPPGTGFLACLGQEWEAAAARAASATRLVLLRTAVVLDTEGGALPRMALPFRLFVGGALGSGRQYLSWIHLEDWVRLVDAAMSDDAMAGPLNATAPNPVTNAEFTRTLARVLGRPALMPAPAPALRLVLGEMAEMILTGQRVLPAKALSAGFEFRHPQLEPALRALYGRAA